jgi:hypothetical protein
MIISQIMIFVLGAPALWLLGRPEKWSKYGFICGLAAQPFWYYTIITDHQWGILALNVIYTYNWCQGIYFNFIKNGKISKTKDR